MTTSTLTVTDFVLARLAEDEAAANLCAEMFPPPWEVADRGWRVRIYASEVPEPDLSSDDDDAMTTRSPVVMEVEPARNIQDPRWLSERVEHVLRHDPARVLAQCAAMRKIVELHQGYGADAEWAPEGYCGECEGTLASPCATLRALASIWSSHPDWREEWE